MNKNRKKNKISIENIRGQHYNHRLSDLFGDQDDVLGWGCL